MIRMCVMRLSRFGIPPGCFGPRFATVSGEMQVNPAAKNVIRMLWMNRDRVSIRNLAFCPEMTTADLPPCPTSIGAAENAQ